MDPRLLNFHLHSVLNDSAAFLVQEVQHAVVVVVVVVVLLTSV